VVKRDAIDAVDDETFFPFFRGSIASRGEEAVQYREEYCSLKGKLTTGFSTNVFDDLGNPAVAP
jgi:hypothetical protein